MRVRTVSRLWRSPCWSLACRGVLVGLPLAEKSLLVSHLLRSTGSALVSFTVHSGGVSEYVPILCIVEQLIHLSSVTYRGAAIVMVLVPFR